MRLLKRCYPLLALLALVAASVQATPISRYARFTGNYNYVATGGSLRTDSNTGNYCAVGGSSSQSLSGIPAGSSIVAAYLYWGGSGSTTDASVTLNAATVTASRTFSSTMSDGTGRVFFGGFADVTSRISGNGTVTFSGLTVDTGGQYCSTATVVAGWGLVVVYGSSNEPLRAINIFDGLDTFFGSALSLMPDGFRIPASGINGKMTAITWDGDPGNSGASGGFSESLTFNGSTLDDGIVPADSSPAVQQFDGTISNFGAGVNNSYGVDVDTYDVSAYLSTGQTTATTNYSAGADRVFLTAQIISVTSEPVVDLSITKSHTGNFSVGSNGVFTLRVANGNSPGVIAVDYPITVTDVLPAGLSFVSGVGTGWSCAAAGQTVTCTNPNNLSPGSSLPDITLTVAVGNGVFPNGNTAQNVNINNTATVIAAGTVDIASANNSATDTILVLGSNLSTSTKTVADLNGGEANPGDTLRYTITLTNSTAIPTSGASVTDNVPVNVTGFNVVSIPGGATNGSTGSGTGTNNTGYVNITGITVPANGSVTIMFDVTVSAGTSPGATIDNTATILNPAGVGATPNAAQVVVSPSLIAGSGTKQLYLWNNGTFTRALYRTPPSGAHTNVTINGASASSVWTITPALQQAISLQSGNFAVYLRLARSGNNTGSSRSVTVTLSNSALGTLASASNTVPATASLVNFSLNLGSAVMAPIGSTFQLTVTNTTAQSNRSVTLAPFSGASYSRVELNSLTVINVDSVQTYNAAYSGGVVTTSFVRGSTAYVRAVVSDPFGSFDISGATITLRNPSGTDVVTTAAMTQVNDSGAATKTYQYAYTIPVAAPAGVWTARVTASEGTEGAITDLGVGTFTVTIPLPALQVSKVSTVLWDPVNLNINPKRIPGSIVSYTITVTNTGPGSVDASTLVMTDTIPANTTLCVSNVGPCASIQFADGAPVSGLSYNSGNTTFSNTPGGGAPFSYSPTADANGVDAAITGISIAPSGSLSAAGGSGNPGFSISFRVKVN